MLCETRFLLLESVTREAQHRSGASSLARISIAAHRCTREAAPRVQDEHAPNAGTGKLFRKGDRSSMAAPQPGIGDWYRQKEGGALFEVVAFDDDDGTIEIQYFDGTVEEMDVEDWDCPVGRRRARNARNRRRTGAARWTWSPTMMVAAGTQRRQRARPARERPRRHRPLRIASQQASRPNSSASSLRVDARPRASRIPLRSSAARS